MIKLCASDSVHYTLESSQGTTPSNASVHNLPDEVLFKIFRKACEELNLDDLEPNIPRPRRYPIIHTARAICRRWRQLVGDYDRDVYNKRYFWYTYVHLKAESQETLSNLAITASKFKWSLDASQESEIWVAFYLPLDRKEGAMDFSGTDAALLSQFMRSVDFTIPHQEQIVYYEIFTRQPQFLSHLLNSLMFRMKPMNLCPTINFRGPLPPLPDILSASSILPSSFLSNSLTTMSPLAHLEYFDLFEHDLSWLDCTIMKFPFSITDLVIPPVNLLKASGFLGAIGNDLISLSIGNHNSYYTPDWLDKKEFGSLKEHITFSSLLNLEIRSTCDSWVERFLKRATFPRLKSAKFNNLSTSFLSSRSDSGTNIDSLGQSSVTSTLQKLSVIDVPPSRSSIFCIIRFLQCTIRDLTIELGDLREESILVSLLNPYLKGIQPERLEIGKIRMANLKTNLFILSSLNLTCLQQLVIRNGKSYRERYLLGPELPKNPRGYQETRDGCHLFLAKLGFFPIKLLLHCISFRGEVPSDLLILRIILGCIEARSLNALHFDFTHYDKFERRFDNGSINLDTCVDRLPSIRILNISISDQGLNDQQLFADLLSFAPKLQRLVLEVPVGSIDIASITKLFTTLTTCDSHGLLVPELSSFEAEMKVDSYGQEDSLEGTAAIILDCLEQRNHHGSVSLELCDLSFVMYRCKKLRIVLKHDPSTPSVPSVPSIPSVSNVLSTPSVSNIPNTLSIPNVPNTPSIPNFPRRQFGQKLSSLRHCLARILPTRQHRISSNST